MITSAIKSVCNSYVRLSALKLWLFSLFQFKCYLNININLLVLSSNTVQISLLLCSELSINKGLNPAKDSTSF